jgi:glycosyltransferase involved in cell wall biosynthesis
MRLALTIHDLKPGGAERVCSEMANYWARQGVEVYVILLSGGHASPFYPLDARVQLKHLDLLGNSRGIFGGLLNNYKRGRAMRRTICELKPDSVLSYMSTTNILTLISTLGTGIPVLVCEHIYPKNCTGGWIWETLRKWTYPFADSVVTLTQSGLDCFSPSIRKHGCFIFNPIMVPSQYWGCSLSRKALASSGTILAMGRLDHQKGFDMLIRAFSAISANHINWTLEIWGDGPDRIALEALVNELGLKDRVKLPGVTREPFEKFKAADVFVLSSRHEGFPLVLCEAMACGLPVISFDCMTGPRDIIRDGVDGVLVPSGQVEALIQSMDLLIRNPDMRKHLAVKATDIVKRLSMNAIMGQWKDLINRVINTRTGGE